MFGTRGDLEVGTLLKIVLGLVVVLLVLEIVGEILEFTFWLLSLLPTLVGIAIVVLIVLWFLDRL
ncbi:MAG TPA: hypothetical protein VJ898_11270 [Natrialbaceae archaeon]|nr:hypothetical protein [Natrialbaceae archaeon]